MGCNTSQEKPTVTPQVDDEVVVEAEKPAATEAVASPTDAVAAVAVANGDTSVNGVAGTTAEVSASQSSSNSSSNSNGAANGKATDVAPLAAPDESKTGDEDVEAPTTRAVKCNGSAEHREPEAVAPVAEQCNTNGSVVLNGEVMGKAEEDAAVKIQSVFRGHKVRTDMKQGDQTTDGSSTSGGAGASAKNGAVAEAGEPTREELEAEFREDDKELCNAATRIQATFRGHLSRKLATEGGAALKDEKDLEEITKKVAEELDIDMNDPELHKAATKIQASFRGHKARQGPDAN